MSWNEIVVNRLLQDVKSGVVQSEPLVKVEINVTAVAVRPEIMLVVLLRLHKILNLLGLDWVNDHNRLSKLGKLETDHREDRHLGVVVVVVDHQ